MKNTPNKQESWRYYDLIIKAITAIFFSLTVALVLLLVANLFWTLEFARRVNKSFPIAREQTTISSGERGPTVTLSYPENIPFNQPANLVVTFQPNGQPVSPFRLKLETSKNNLLFCHPSNNVPSDQIVLDFEGDQQEQQSIILINRKNENNLFLRPADVKIKWVEPTGKYVLELRDQDQPVLGVETSLISSFRKLQGSLLDNNSPILVILPAVTALLTALYQRNKDEEQKKKEVEEKNKIAATELLKELRENLLDQNVEEAQKKLQEIQEKGYAPLIHQSALDHARKTIAIGMGSIDGQINWQQPPEDWLGEIAGALVAAGKQSPELLVRITNIRRSFPFDRCSADSANALKDLQETLPTQAHKNWPRRPPAAASLESLPHTKQTFYDPFPHERAELEEQYLFQEEHTHFWAQHPIHQSIDNSTCPVFCITGEPGSGKTALAFAVGKYASKSKCLGVTLTGTPRVQDIYRSFTLRLLHYLRLHPTHLGYLDSHERQLLVELFRSKMSSTMLQAEIDRMGHTETWQWLELADSDQKKALWKAEAETQIRLLRIEAQKGRVKEISENEWPFALNHICSALRFANIQLAIDLGQPCTPDWAERVILPNLQPWRMSNIKAVIFVTAAAGEALRLNGLSPCNSDVEIHPLCWQDTSKNWIENFVYHRWERANERNSIYGYIPQKKLEEMIQCSKANPRLFIVQWKKYRAEHQE